ncbi:MAG TPA: hypothetical protein PK674_03500 [Candidatus Absconditabacterales bacterium]|nr:hypothetical protein [Candidatus Absconditabacterales bacterium]HOQ79365.1 hypothetical protein [Candidatus Absconditabacterales bacterium]
MANKYINVKVKTNPNIEQSIIEISNFNSANIKETTVRNIRIGKGSSCFGISNIIKKRKDQLIAIQNTSSSVQL